LNDEDLADTGRVRLFADQYFKKLMGNESKHFRFTNNEFISMASVNEEPRLFSIAYRYIRVLDGRDVKGMTSQVIIEIGQNCKIRRFTINDQKLEKVGYIDKKIKNTAMKKYLEDHIDSEKYKRKLDGIVDVPIKSTDVMRGWESYFFKQYGNDKYLEPHMSFFTIDTFEDGDTLRRVVHLPVDAAKIPNKKDEDILEYELHTK